MKIEIDNNQEEEVSFKEGNVVVSRNGSLILVVHDLTDFKFAGLLLSEKSAVFFPNIDKVNYTKNFKGTIKLIY